jgi:acyl carrier protein
MPKQPAVAQKVLETLGSYLEGDPHRIGPEYSLRDDLGLDSMATIELLYNLEEAFDLTIPDQDLEKLRTVGDVITYIEGRVKPSHKQVAPVAASASKAKKKKG